MILEYMLIMEAGKKLCPSWVEDGGHFQNPDDFTLIGWSPDEGKRDYYVPDSVVRLTRQQLIDRVLAIYHKHKTEDSPDEDQIIAMVNTWCDDHGE